MSPASVILRLFALFEAAIMLVLSGVTLWYYAKVWARGGGGALPQHVLMLGSGCMIVVLSVCGFIAGDVATHHPMRWYGTPLFVPGLLLINAGLGRLLFHERRLFMGGPGQ